MKRMIFLVTFFVTFNAHATKARLRALNQDANGSYYVADTRNVFLNPAQISLMKEHLNFESGKQERTGVQSTSADNEGGFVMELGSGKLGVQLGRVSDFHQFIREINAVLSDVPATVTGATGGTFKEGQNNLDIIYGGGTDLRWGGGLAISRSKTATGASHKETTVQSVDLRGGIDTDRFEAYGSFILASHSETAMANTSAKLSEAFGLKAGGGFQVSPEYRVFTRLTYDKFAAERANVAEYDGKRLSVLGGAAMIHNLKNYNGRLFASAELMWVDIKAPENKGAPEEKFGFFGVPLTLGLEADANTWLRLRASVRQNVLLGTIKTTAGGTTDDSHYWENSPNNTSVAAGGGVTLNAFNFDASMVQAVNNENGHFEASLTYLF